MKTFRKKLELLLNLIIKEQSPNNESNYVSDTGQSVMYGTYHGAQDGCTKMKELNQYHLHDEQNISSSFLFKHNIV